MFTELLYKISTYFGSTRPRNRFRYASSSGISVKMTKLQYRSSAASSCKLTSSTTGRTLSTVTCLAPPRQGMRRRSWKVSSMPRCLSTGIGRQEKNLRPPTTTTTTNNNQSVHDRGRQSTTAAQQNRRHTVKGKNQ